VFQPYGNPPLNKMAVELDAILDKIAADALHR
jgi:hypothetical protein